MQNETNSQSPAARDGRDNELWGMAKRRAAFKISVFTYVSVNCMLVAIWYFTSGPAGYFWPIWSMLGWGIGVASQYVHAYHGNNIFSVQKEYDNLKQQQN